ncbi:MAG: hypothetical protein NTV34_08335 [Proteobacteria bacterium]|nr:hypothetical protein [Pseudomonadota bacterium]
MKRRSFRNCGKLFFLAMLPCTLAFGQLQSIRESSAYRSANFGAELKPLPTILSSVPGVASGGLGLELSMGGHVSTFANAYVIDSNLPAYMRKERDENEMPVLKKMQGYAADIGSRFYSDLDGLDSWYGGAKMGYSYGKGQWTYRKEEIDSTVRTLNPGLEGGYRWIWPSNLMLRLGAGADANAIQENEATAGGQPTAATKEASETIKDYLTVSVVPRVDLGVGYRF